MKLKIKIAEVAGQHGLKHAFALQNALKCSPTMASRLWKGNFKQIGVETIESLCELFQCSPNDFLEYPLTQKSKTVTQTSKAVTQTSKADNPAEILKRLKESSGGSVISSPGRIAASDEIASDNENLLSTVEVAERLNVSRRSVGDYIKSGKLRAVKGKQNHNFIRESDLLAFVAGK